jgi:hypothetical protein
MRLHPASDPTDARRFIAAPQFRQILDSAPTRIIRAAMGDGKRSPTWKTLLTKMRPVLRSPST